MLEATLALLVGHGRRSKGKLFFFAGGGLAVIHILVAAAGFSLSHHLPVSLDMRDLERAPRLIMPHPWPTAFGRNKRLC